MKERKKNKINNKCTCTIALTNVGKEQTQRKSRDGC